MAEAMLPECALAVSRIMHQRLSEVNDELAVGVSELGLHIRSQRRHAIRELLTEVRHRLDRMDKLFSLFDELVDE